jgi:hypothetical protein
MQKLASFLGLNIGFLFRQQGAFEKGIAKLARTRPELAAYHARG